MTVRTFELEGCETRDLGEAESLASASAGLPAGSYTSLRTYGGNRVLRLGQHVKRLEESVALQGLPATLDPAHVRTVLAAALAATRHPESRVRLTFAPPRFFVSVEPFEPLPEALYREGVAGVTLSLQRENPHSKDTRFIATARGAYGALPAGAHEGLLVADEGSVLEGLSSNFFAVRDGVLRTEEGRVLRGVTRAVVLEMAEGLLPVERTAVRKDELDAVTEAFITSVSREVLPVVRIDGKPLGEGRPGPKTRALIAAFTALARREAQPV
jgi:branched-chain amino acid aminotransferase